jgi:hypothetical protein
MFEDDFEGAFSFSMALLKGVIINAGLEGGA